MTNANSEVQPTNQHEAVGSGRRIVTIIGVAGSAALMGILASNPFSARGEEVPCDPNMDVCVPGVTAPPDEEYVPGNPVPGEEIPIDPEFDDKGGDLTTTSTSTTTSSTTTTAPTTTTTAPTTTTTAPTTTVVVTTTSTTLPPEITQPPITVEVPVIPQVTE